MNRIFFPIACIVIVYSTTLSAVRAQSAAPVSSHQLVLRDGRHAVVSRQKFMLVSPNGQLIPAPAGAYTLANGVELNVDASGTPHQLNRNKPKSGGGVIIPAQITPAATVLESTRSPPDRAGGSDIAGLSTEKLVAPPAKKALTLCAVATHLFSSALNFNDRQSTPAMSGQIWVSVTDDSGQPIADLKPEEIEIDCLDIPPGAAIAPPFSSPAVLDFSGSRIQDGLVHFKVPKLALGNHYYRIHIKLDRGATPSGESPVHYEGQTLVSALYVGLPDSANAYQSSYDQSLKQFRTWINVYPPGGFGSP